MILHSSATLPLHGKSCIPNTCFAMWGLDLRGCTSAIYMAICMAKVVFQIHVLPCEDWIFAVMHLAIYMANVVVQIHVVPCGALHMIAS